MSKTNNSIGSIPTINVGIVGHIDHGKTTLLYKLSGKWTDTHSEEMKRGITIKLGYADIVVSDDKGNFNKDGKGTPVRHVSFVDNPGHEMLMATMLSGAAMIDAAVLVVAANEGIKPQTREHLMALQAKRVPYVIVVQNKIDLVTKEQAIKNHKDIQELIKGKYDNAPIIPVSAQQDVNLDKVYKAIAEAPLPDRKPEGEPLFIIARSFDINKPGTTPDKLHGAILGGTLRYGRLKIGDEIEIKPGRVIKEANQFHYKTIKSKVVKLFNGSGEVSELVPGGSMSIETELDMALGKSDALAGNISSLTGKLPETKMEATLKYKLFPEVYGPAGWGKTEGIKPSEMLMLSVHTSIGGGMVKHVKGDKIDISLKVPMVAFKGDNVAIARNVGGHWRLIGYGELL